MTESTDRLHELRMMPYAEYLQTPEWQAKRTQALQRAENRCQVCNTTESLNVHHRTYERRGNEEMSDLTVLCEGCHELFHTRMKQESIPDLYTQDRHKYAYNWIANIWDVSYPPQNYSFRTFNGRVPGVQEAFHEAEEYAQNPEGTLLFAGGYGVGKTHLMAAICNVALAASMKCRFVSAPYLFHAIQHYRQNNQSYYNLIKNAIEAEILFIDDIDKAKWSEFREDIYFSIIDAREKLRAPMVLSVNRIDDVPKYVGAAVSSRLKSNLIPIIMDKVRGDYREKLK